MHVKTLTEFTGRMGAATLTRLPHILCADDDPALRRALTRLLIHAGYKVTVAKDGLEAWEALQADRFDLLITDQEMPRLDGLGLAAKARLHGLSVPVILMSGSLEAVGQAEGPRFAGALLKPCSGNLLLKVVERALSQPAVSTQQEEHS